MTKIRVFSVDLKKVQAFVQETAEHIFKIISFLSIHKNYNVLLFFRLRKTVATEWGPMTKTAQQEEDQGIQC